MISVFRRQTIFSLLVFFFSLSAGAYDFEEGDILLRPVLGARINVVRFESVTRGTPAALVATGLEADFIVDQSIGVTLAIRPMIIPGFATIGAGLGPKFRVDIDAPLVPYFSFLANFDTLLPLGTGVIHYNIGGRAAFGMDYFVMSDFAVGLEVAGIPSFMWMGSTNAFEMGIDALLGFTWRV